MSLSVNIDFIMSIFVTGTDTDVGKTIVTAGIAAVMQGFGYSMGVYKPVQSGAVKQDGGLVSPDLQFVKSIDSNVFTKASYNLIAPTAPLVAAIIDNIKIDLNRIKIDYELMRENNDFVIVEGAGGALVPVYDDIMMLDIPKMLKLPVLIVARPYLGTINHTLLTIEAIKNKGLDILGVIISNYPEGTDDVAVTTAPDIINEITGVKILGLLPHMDEINADSPSRAEVLIDKVINCIDVQEIFNIKIPKLFN